MRVLLVGNYLPDRQDSMQLYAELLQRGLRQRGHDVHLLQPPAVLGGITADDQASSKWLGYADKFLLFRGALRRAAAQADVVHVCDHSNAMYVPVIRHVPHIVTCHDILAIRSAMGHFPQNRVGATGRVFQRLITRGLRQAQHILCVSEKTREDLRTYLAIPESRLRVVPNALHWPYAPVETEKRATLLASMGLGDEPYFLHLGANHWYKNRAGAVAIFASLRSLPAYQDAKLVMAGGPITPELEAAAREHGVRDAMLAVPGPGNLQLAALYSGAIATLFPSLEEGFGWPILESQACGCPVVVADRAPMNQISGGAAILIDPAQPAEAARHIEQELAKADALRAAGVRNAATYTADRMLDGCEAMYRQAVEEQPRA